MLLMTYRKLRRARTGSRLSSFEKCGNRDDSYLFMGVTSLADNMG